MAQARWYTIETSDNVFSAAALTALDSIITFQRQNGASVWFGLYGTPAFFAGSTPNPSVGDNTKTGVWGGVGESGHPTDLTKVTRFVNLIVNRYNKPGGAWYDANFATLGKGIQAWETWNEPPMGNAGNNANFYWGTASQMVDLAYTQYAAIKALDPSIVVTSPGFAGIADNFAPLWFPTVGGSTGKTGLQSCDAFSPHLYSINPPGVSLGTWAAEIISQISRLKKVLADGGWSVPIWVGECGVTTVANQPTMLNWYEQPANYRYVWYSNLLKAMAALGIQTVCFWNWEDPDYYRGTSGYWQPGANNDDNGVVKAFNEVTAKVAGKTIVSGTYTQGGNVSLAFSDGTTW